MLSTPDAYPKRPYIGVDCSGQPRSPPMIAVATRWSRRNKQNKFVVEVTTKQLEKYSSKYRDWQEKLYAALFFKSIDHIFQPGYKIHIDKEFETTHTETKVLNYLLNLFGKIHPGDDLRQKPEIEFHTKWNSEYVRHADMKTKLARKGKVKIDDKTSLDWLMQLLEERSP